MGVAPEISTEEEEEEVVTLEEEEEEEEARRAHHRVGGVRPGVGRGVIDPPPPNVSLRNACLAHATMLPTPKFAENSRAYLTTTKQP